MDAKKTNLTPELKEIYDRVMNTKGGAASPAVTGALPTTPSPPAPPSMQTAPIMPAAPQMPTSPGLGGPPPDMPPPPGMPAAPEMPSLGTNAEQALTSTPARPISEGDTFAFSGGNVKAVPGAAPAPAAPQVSDGTKKKAKISLPVLVVLGVVFIVVWGVFWAIVLGLIQR